MGQDKPRGSVMVVGGGISGIQAALSLTDAGYGVFLVEHSTSLGGMIPNLHRIYPLCACCKVDPKIAAVEQNPNIKLMLNTTVINISGDIGNFSIQVKTENGKETIQTGAVVLAAGLEVFEPEKYQTYSYGVLPNVITSVEYEQMQRPLGPEKGVPKRPSDGNIPQKIAWLQCVGSRDINQCDAPYCSSVCCMYALKEAINTKDFDEDIDTAIFFMDMRTHGKGFEDYLNSAISRDVRLVRSRIHTIDSVTDTDNLLIIYADETGQLQREVFDMVVLSVGLRPSSQGIELAKKIGIDLDQNQFINTAPFKPVSTNKEGIFVCGCLGSPVDINQSITQASASASEIASALMPESFSAPRKYPEPSNTMDEEPHALIAYHLCPGMEADLGHRLEEYAMKIPGVAGVVRADGDIISILVKELRERGANRLIFASCTPLIHTNLIEEALRLAALNPFLYQTVDLKLMSPQDPSNQLEDRIRMGIARANFISPPPLRQVPVIRRALVVGGGIAGLENALALSKEGYPVTLVEKTKELGGHGLHVRVTWNGYDVQEYLKTLIASVKKDKNITVMTNTRIKENRGFAGNFVTTVEKKGQEVDISHGVTILAPGGDPFMPKEYLYGQHRNVFLWSELALKMIEDPSAIEKAEAGVFIQCVGSREPERPYCSNLCCSNAVRTALDLKGKNPDMNIYILYREMRTFGEREDIYREARGKGIMFIRYDIENKAVVEPGEDQDKLRVTVYDPVLERSICIESDFVSLQTAIVATNNQNLSEIFKINLDPHGFFAESPEKLRPVDTSSKGIYVAGLAHYPKDTAESITQAKAAASRALEILKQDTIQVGGMVAEVRPEKCAECCTCVRTCPFNIPYIDVKTGAAYIDPGLCQGCGMCVAECPGKAIVMSTCSDQMLNELPSMALGIS